MSFFDDLDPTKQPTATTKKPQPVVAKAQTGGFFSDLDPTVEPVQEVAPTKAQVIAPVEPIAPESPTGEYLSMPKGNEYRSVFDTLKEWSDGIFNHNKGSVSRTVKNQQKAFEDLQKAPSNLDVMTPEGLKSPFKSVQTARDTSATTIESLSGGTQRGLTDVSRGDIPVVGPWIDVYDLGKELQYKNALNNGKQLSREELSDLLEITTRRTNQEKKSQDTGYQVGQTVKTSASFMSELWLASLLAPETGGASIGALATEVAGKGVLKGVKYVAKKMIDDKLTRDLIAGELKKYGVKGGVLIGSQTAIHAPESAIQKMIGSTEFSNNAGKVDVSFVNDGQSVSDAVVNSITESFVETSSEFSGGLLRILAKPIQTGLIKSGILKATLANNPDVPTNAVMKFFEKAGWHGVAEEFGEERVADIMYGVFHSLGMSDQDFHIPTAKQVATELASFALMGTGIKGISEGYNIAIAKKLNETPTADDKQGKFVEELGNKVKEGLKNDSASDVVRALKESGIDQDTAIRIVMDSATEQDKADASSLSPEDIQAEIDAFMGTAPTEEPTTEIEQPITEEPETTKQDQVSQPTKMVTVESPVDLSIIPEEKQAVAEQDWQDNYAESYQEKYEDSQRLEKQLKTAKGEVKRSLSSRIKTINDQLVELEDTFIKKYAPEQEEEVKALETKKVSDLGNGPVFEPAPFNETFDENPVTFKEGTFVVGRDGRVAEVTSSNDRWSKDDPTYSMNIGHLRTRRIGDTKDYGEYANQIRLASFNEIQEAQKYAEENPPIEEKDSKKPKKTSDTTKKRTKEEKKDKKTSKVEKKDIQIGDVFNTDGVTNMESPVTVTSLETYGDTNDFGNNDIVSDAISGTGNNTTLKHVYDEVKGLDKTSEESNIDSNEQDNRPDTISDTSDVSAETDMGGSGEVAGEISGYDRATMLVESGNGFGTDSTSKLSKKERQLVNEQVEALLETKEYSTDPNTYSVQELDLMRAYSGAGGKESVGGEGAGLLNEYYTPREIILHMWNIVERLMPNAETAFEPSAGTGKIITEAPASIKVDGAEISKVSGTIAQILNPDSNITIGDFQELFFDKKTNKKKVVQQYDILIGNPPFGAREGFLKGKGEESTINRQEEYFIKRGLDMTKDGGYLVYVVNSSFLKTKMSKGKEEIAKLGGLVGAYRLPENSFEDTSIGTDIVIFKKGNTDINSDEYLSRVKSFNSDSYFEENPTNKLGAHMLRKNRFGQTESYVKGDLESALKLLGTLLPEPAKTIDVVEEVAPIITPLENKKIEKQKKATKEDIAHLLGEDKKKTTKKEKVTEDSSKTMPKENWQELVVPVQNVSNKKGATPTEVAMLKRIDRDLSIPNPSESELPYLNYEDGKYYPDAIYYSGNIAKKIKYLEENKKTVINQVGEAQYEKQVEGLHKAKPEAVALKDIAFDPMDRHVVNLKLTDERGNEITILQAFTRFISRRDAVALSPRVTISDIKKYVNQERANNGTKPITGHIMEDATRLFNQFMKTELEPEIAKQVQDKFNVEKNAIVTVDYSQLPVEIQNMAEKFRGQTFQMSETQRNGVGFLVNKGSGIIAYGVGVGKTHTLAIATVANMQKGWSKRPLFTVPSATISKTWLATLHEMFPDLVINNLDGLQADVVRRLKKTRGDDTKNWIKDGELTIISHKGLLRLGFKDEEMEQAIGDLNDAMFAEPSKKTKRAGELEIDKAQVILGSAQKNSTDYGFDLGIDHISVDEVHNFRKIFQGAKPENLDKDGNQVGQKRFGNVIGGTPAKQAQALFLLTQYIQRNNNGRNVFLASATPFENHATEVYSILSLVARDRLKEMGIYNINDFFALFAKFEVESDRRLDGEWLNRSKMKGYNNLPTLQKLVREFIDRQEDPTLVRPEKKVITPHLAMSDLQKDNLVKIQELLTGVKAMVNDTEAFNEESITMYDVASDDGEVEDGAFLKASTYSIANSVSPYFIKEYTSVRPTGDEIIENSPKIKYSLEVAKRIKDNPKTKDFGTFLYFGKHGVDYHPLLAETFASKLGYDKSQVAYLSGKMTEEEKEKVKEDFNTGKVKVLIGGDQTKEGIDLQNNGFVTVNLALGWNPTEVQQVGGRVWRQGNNRSFVFEIYPLVENSGDATIYNKFEEKGGRINDIFSYVGMTFDVGEVDPAEKKLALLTDPKDKAKMQIEIDRTVYSNEYVLVDNDIKSLNKISADLEQSKHDVTYYEQESEKSYLSDERKKEYKRDVKAAKERIIRLEKKLSDKGITDVRATVGELQAKLVDLEAKMKGVEATYEPLLAKFTEEYKIIQKNRKTIEQYMGDIDTAMLELEERTPAEVAKIRAEKIQALEEMKRKSIPEFQRIEDNQEDIRVAQNLSAEAYDLFKAHEVGNITKEQFDARYDELTRKFESLSLPKFEKIESGKEPMIKFVEGKKRIEEYQKRLGLNFDVDFADVIFTGEYLKGVVPVKAYAVTYNDKITLTENIKLTTADHEMVHIVVDNIEKIDAFKGITKEALLLAQNNGKKYTEEDYERLNEELAIGFQKKVLGEEQSRVPIIIRRFYDKLQILLTDMFRAMGRDIDIISDFYRKMSVAKSNSQVNLTSSDILDKRAQYSRNGITGLDFSFEQMREMDDIRRKLFERVSNETGIDIKNFSLDRKDLGWFNNYLANAKNIYISNRKEFKAAKMIDVTSDKRLMQKEIADKRVAEVLKPYFALELKDIAKVNAVLMMGDEARTEYDTDQLRKAELNDSQIEAYIAVRTAFNRAHKNLLAEMAKNGASQEQIKDFERELKGYIPHKWKYDNAVKFYEPTEKGYIEYGTKQNLITEINKKGPDFARELLASGILKISSMSTYKTRGEAEKVVKDTLNKGELAIFTKLTSLSVDFFSEQRFSIGNMRTVIAQAKTSQDVKDQLLGGLSDLVKEKGFGRQYIHRGGVAGYEKEDLAPVIANYFSGLNGFITKMEAGKEYFTALESITERDQPRFYAWIRDTIAFDMGNTVNTIAPKIPGTDVRVDIKEVAFITHLAWDLSYMLINATQNLTIGVGELSTLVDGKIAKLFKPEAEIMKAVVDYATGRISAEEKIVVEGLLKAGRLGGEMTAELMDFKNNPLYRTISSDIRKALYASSAGIEKNINRVPAFLVARRLLVLKGVTVQEGLNEQALEMSDKIHIRAKKTNLPRAFRGPIGGVVFIFQNFTREMMYGMYENLSQKQFMAFSKKMFYTALLGGVTSLPLAKMILAVVTWLFPDPDDEVADELNSWSLALKRGIPASFANIDLSGRVSFDIMTITSLFEGETPKSTFEKVFDIRNTMGAISGVFARAFDGYTLFTQGRYLEAGGKLPDFIGNPLKAYQGYTNGVYSKAGNPLMDKEGDTFMYTPYEAFVKATGFTPTREQLAWDEMGKQWVSKQIQSEKSSGQQALIKSAILQGDIEKAKELQQEGLASGALTEKSRDYVKDVVKEKTMKDNLDKWNTATKSRALLDKMERDITKEVYGEGYTKTQLTNITRDFAFYRTFGLNDKLANEVKEAKTVADKVEILKKAREEMTLEEFKAFYRKGRAIVKYENTSKGAENTGYVLITDSVRDAYFKK